MIETAVRDAPDVAIGRGSRYYHVGHACLQEFFCQAHAETIVAVIKVAQSQQADAALQRFLELLAEVFHRALPIKCPPRAF